MDKITERLENYHNKTIIQDNQKYILYKDYKFWVIMYLVLILIGGLAGMHYGSNLSIKERNKELVSVYVEILNLNKLENSKDIAESVINNKNINFTVIR